MNMFFYSIENSRDTEKGNIRFKHVRLRESRKKEMLGLKHVCFTNKPEPDPKVNVKSEPNMNPN